MKNSSTLSHLSFPLKSKRINILITFSDISFHIPKRQVYPKMYYLQVLDINIYADVLLYASLLFPIHLK